MTDRELLEAAAKAAGIELCWFEVGEDPDCAPGWYCSNVTSGGMWNPLTDDGDALRLAVKLRIHLTIGGIYTAASGPSCGTVEHSADSTDHYAATRRAITRAAAAMAKGTP